MLFKSVRSKILPTVTVCGAALFLLSTQSVLADQTSSGQNTPVVVNTTIQERQTNNVAVSQNTGNYNQNDHGNYAWLDHAALDNEGQLNVVGWHATNEAVNRPYHYLIALNQDQQEIARANITGQSVSRPDVQAAHNVYHAGQSGFVTRLNISGSLQTTNSVTLISRYTNDASGNSNYVDYWFAPVTIDQTNHGWLDNASVKNDQLELSGWNATNRAAGHPYHYIILLDRTTGREVSRQLVTTGIERTDVAKVYPEVTGAGQTGFTVHFNLAGINFSHQLQALSRYAEDAAGNANYVDFYYQPITTGNYTNQGWLDAVNISDGKNLSVSGWHADDISRFENQHFIILFDNTDKHQVAVVRVINNDRPDVQKVYPNITTADRSGFNAQFALNNDQLCAGHSYSIVSRYSTSSAGNGDAGQYTDMWFKAFTLNQQEDYLDSIKMQGDGLQVAGWMASDYSLNRPHAFIIVMTDGREVARKEVSLTARPDVAQACPTIFNSLNSGFQTTINFNPAIVTGKLQLILRFTDDPAGNGDFSDQDSASYANNDGWFDQIDVSDKGIYVSGWHASDQSANKPYQYLIFIDTRTGQELYRQRVLDINRVRGDLANQRPYILNSRNSGYRLYFDLPANLDHHTVRIIHRFTDDINGNGNYVDLTSNPVKIHDDRWAWPFPAIGKGSFNFDQLFGVHPGNRRINSFHDGLDFGSYGHPGSMVQAIHDGTIVKIGYAKGLENYVVEDTGEYLIIYQEGFLSPNNIAVHVGQKINVGDPIGIRNNDHVHIGITRQHNFWRAEGSAYSDDGTWLDPLAIISNGLNG